MPSPFISVICNFFPSRAKEAKKQKKNYAWSQVSRDPDLIECNLNHDLSSISDWLVANKLTLNKSKTEFMQWLGIGKG